MKEDLIYQGKSLTDLFSGKTAGMVSIIDAIDSVIQEQLEAEQTDVVNISFNGTEDVFGMYEPLILRKERAREYSEQHEGEKNPVLNNNLGRVAVLPYGLAGLSALCSYMRENAEAEIHTKALRELRHERLSSLPSKDAPDYKDAYNKAKDDISNYKCNHFYATAFSLIGGYRKKEHLKYHSNLFSFDFDEIETDFPNYETHEERMLEVYKFLMSDQSLNTVFLFQSPTGRGYKLVLYYNIYAHLKEKGIIQPTLDDITKAHEYIYTAHCNYFRNSGITPDTNCKDLARACFLPHDPNCYFNEKFIEAKKEKFDVEYWANFGKQIAELNVEKPRRSTQSLTKECNVEFLPELTKAQIEETICQLELKGVDITDEYNDWVNNIGFPLAYHFGEEGRELFHRMSRLSLKYDVNYCNTKYDNLVKTCKGEAKIGSLFGFTQANAGIVHKELCKDVYKQMLQEVSNGVIHSSKSAESANPQYISKGEETDKNNINLLNINDINNNQSISSSLESMCVNADNADLKRKKINKTFSPLLADCQLPIIFRDVYEYYKDKPQACDIAILSLTAQLGAPLDHIFYVHDNCKIYSSAFLMVVGPSGSDKNVLSQTAQLFKPLQKQYEGEYQEQYAKYESEHALWEAKGKKKGEPEPKCPLEPKIVIDSNVSNAGLLQAMKANGGFIILNESEAAKIKEMSGNSWSQYMSILRQAMSGETISSTRATKGLSFNIDNPRVGIAMATQPTVPKTLFPNATLGDIQRITFYDAEKEERKFENRFGKTDAKILVSDLYAKLGLIYLDIFNQMNKLPREVDLVLSKEQEEQLFQFIKKCWDEFGDAFGDVFDGKLVRLPLEMNNMILVLSLLYRYEEREDNGHPLFEQFEQSFSADQRAIDICLIIMEVLMRHTSAIWQKNSWDVANIAPKLNVTLTPQQLELYTTLTEDFSKKDWDETCTKLGMQTRTTERWLTDFATKYQIIEKVSHGRYRKCHG